MYKLLKDKGTGANVIIENTSTKASVIIGKLNTKIIKILEDAEYKVNITEEWNIEINSETAKSLIINTAMKIKKPIRDQRKKTANEINRKMYNKEIDAMDVLLGLANYN